MQGADRLHHLEEYFFSKKLKEIQALREAGVEVINLGIGSPDMAPSDAVIDSLYFSAQHSGNHGYQPYHGTEVLRNEICNWMNDQFNVQLNPNSEVLPLMGSKEGILHVSLAFLNPGDTVAIPELGYPAYRSIATMVGAKVVEYPLDDQWQPDWRKMDKIGNAKLLWMNYPNMPTGASASEQTFKEALDFAKKYNVLICHDNPYSHVLNENPISILKYDEAKKYALELHSLSKSHNMAGWRVGWVCGDQKHIENILKIKSNIDSGMFRGVQDAAVTALKLDQNFHNVRNLIYQKRQLIGYAILRVLDCTFMENQSGMFVWGRLPNSVDSERFTDSLLKASGVFITPGTIFGNKGKNYIRVSLCCEEAVLGEALKRLQK